MHAHFGEGLPHGQLLLVCIDIAIYMNMHYTHIATYILHGLSCDAYLQFYLFFLLVR